jgi:hypothetical protein
MSVTLEFQQRLPEVTGIDALLLSKTLLHLFGSQDAGSHFLVQ